MNLLVNIIVHIPVATLNGDKSGDLLNIILFSVLFPHRVITTRLQLALSPLYTNLCEPEVLFNV